MKIRLFGWELIIRKIKQRIIKSPFLDILAPGFTSIINNSYEVRNFSKAEKKALAFGDLIKGTRVIKKKKSKKRKPRRET
jgi:hypothetical protein